MQFHSQIMLSIQHKQLHGQRFTTLMGIRNVSVDFCKYVTGVGGSLLIDVLLKNGETNMIQPCPLQVSLGKKASTAHRPDCSIITLNLQ